MNDLIRRSDAIQEIEDFPNCENGNSDTYDKAFIISMIEEVPSAPHVMAYKEVAEIIADLFGDECACNYNGNDEWLPQSCKYAETECPSPKEKNGCWMQFLIQGGADMRGDESE